MSEYNYNAAAKEATVFTKQHNAAFAKAFQIDLEDAYNSEVALARRGCLKKLNGFQLKDKTGNVVWNLEAYDFLKQQAVADTVHPSLWLNGKANIEAGVFEVLPGKIYQVRGIDVANLTFVRSKTRGRTWSMAKGRSIPGEGRIYGTRLSRNNSLLRRTHRRSAAADSNCRSCFPGNYR